MVQTHTTLITVELRYIFFFFSAQNKKKIILLFKLNGVAQTLPYSDSNLDIKNESGTIVVDAVKFFLTFGNGFMKLVSCDTTTCGLCNDNSTNPEQVISKYLPNDQFMIDQTCVSCPTDWTPLNGRCYKGFSSSLSYNNSLADCKSKNASLAILNTNAKFNLVKSLLPSTNSGYYVNGFCLYLNFCYIFF